MTALGRTLLAVVTASNLTSLIYISDEGLTNTEGYGGLFLSDLSCDTLSTPSLWALLPRGLPPLVTVVIYCPHLSTSQPLTESYPGTTNLSGVQTVSDPLAHPLVSLLVLGSFSHGQSVVRGVSRHGLVSQLLVLDPLLHQPYSTNQSWCLRSRVLGSSGQRVGSVSESCHYSGQPRLHSRFSGFGHHTLRVVFIENPFFNNKKVNGSKVIWSGYCKAILDTLALKLDFRYDIMEPADGKWGAFDENGSWVGAVGMVHRKEADLVMTSLTVTVERDQVVDFSEPYFKVHVLVAFSQPSEQLGIIFKPLTRPVWALIGGAALLLGLMLRVTRLTAPSSRPQDDNLSAALLDGLSPFLGKGVEQAPTQIGPWFGLMPSYFMAIILLASFTGHLLGTLAVRRVNMPFTTLEELVEDSTYIVGVDEGNAHYLILKEARTGILPAVFRRVNVHESEAVSQRRALAGTTPTAFFVDSTNPTYVMRPSGICDLFFLPQTFHPSGYAIAMPEGSPFKDIFSREIRRFDESGLLNKWKNQYKPLDKCRLQEALKEHLSPAISLRHISGLFLLLGTGVVAACLVFVLEYCQCLSRTPRSMRRKAEGGGNQDASKNKLGEEDQDSESRGTEKRKGDIETALSSTVPSFQSILAITFGRRTLHGESSGTSSVATPDR